MKLKKEELLNVLNRYPTLKISLAVNNLADSDDLELVDGHIVMQSDVDRKYLERLPSGADVAISIDNFVFNSINALFPNKFPTIEYTPPIEETFIMLKETEYMNQHSSKKRRIVFARDISERQTSTGLNILLVSLGEEITEEALKKVQKVFRRENISNQITVSLEEKGILAYIEKKDEGFDVGEKIQDALAASKIPSIVFSDKHELIARFKSLKPKLVVLAYQQQSLNAMTLYLFIKKMDPFCKILELNEITMEKSSNDLQTMVEEIYERFYYKEIEQTRKRKIKLSELVEEKWKDDILRLANNYEHSKHVVLAYKLQKLCEEYDTIILQNMLNKVKKE